MEFIPVAKPQTESKLTVMASSASHFYVKYSPCSPVNPSIGSIMTKISQEQPSNSPSQKFVHFTFWIAHIGFAMGFALIPSQGKVSTQGTLGFALTILALVSTFGYFIAIGRYASRFGRSAIVWGGLTFITSPVGIWISYIMSFGLKSKTENQ